MAKQDDSRNPQKNQNRQNEIVDESNDRRYFTQIPNIIDDLGLSPRAFRLYVHIKRVTGESGRCWQSTRTLAEGCNMSTGSVSKAKKELAANRLIDVDAKKNKSGGKDFHSIRIADIWVENSLKYANPPDELDNDANPEASSQYELDEGPGGDPSSPGELTSSQYEIKKNLIKNNPKLEEILSLWMELFPEKPQPRPRTKKLQAQVRTRIKDENFLDIWREAMVRASESQTCQNESWFDLYFFLRNEINYQKCFDRWMSWKDEQHYEDPEKGLIDLDGDRSEPAGFPALRAYAKEHGFEFGDESCSCV